MTILQSTLGQGWDRVFLLSPSHKSSGGSGAIFQCRMAKDHKRPRRVITGVGGCSTIFSEGSTSFSGPSESSGLYTVSAAILGCRRTSEEGGGQAGSSSVYGAGNLFAWRLSDRFAFPSFKGIGLLRSISRMLTSTFLSTPIFNGSSVLS